MNDLLGDARYAHRTNEVHSFRVEESCIREFLYSTKQEPEIAEVCSCGHPKRSHSSRCKVSGYECGCQGFSLAAYTADARPFYRETHGPGAFHALEKGLRTAATLGIAVEMAITTACSRGPFHGPAIVVGVSRYNSPSFGKPVKSIMLCQTCSGLKPDYYQEKIAN